MKEESKLPQDGNEAANTIESERLAAQAKKHELRDPRVVLALLEADQVVAAKARTRFGRKKLSYRASLLLWGLRLYVVLMLIVVAISVLHTVHAAH